MVDLPGDGWVVVPNMGTVAPERNYPGIDQTMGAGRGRARAAQRSYDGGAEILGGWGDEFTAGVGALSDFVWGNVARDGSAPLGQLYDENLSIARGQQARYRDERPLAALGANVAGGLALIPARAAGALTTAATLGERVAQGAKAGAAMGAVMGAGEGEGAGRIDTAVMGGGVGGAFGAALPLLGSALKVGQRGFAYVSGLKGSGADVQARKLLIDALKKDGIEPSDIRMIVGGNKPFVLADLGENTRALMGSAGRFAGAGRSNLTDFLEGRTAGQAGRIQGDLAQEMGANPADFLGTAGSIIERRSAAAGPGYEAAYATQAPALTDGLRGILARPSGKAAVGTAKMFMENKGRPVVDADGNYTVQMLDQIQRALRDKATMASGKRANEMAGNLTTLREELLNELPQNLRSVMASYRSESELLDAMTVGGKFMSEAGDELAVNFAKLSPGEQDMFRLGAARALKFKLGAKMDGQDASSMFDTPNMRERLQAIFPDQVSFGRFMDGVKTEGIMQDTRNVLLKGSQTAERAAADEAFQGNALGEAAMDAVSNTGSVGVLGAVMNAGRHAATAGKDRLLSGVSEAVGDRVIRMGADRDLVRAVGEMTTPAPRNVVPSSAGGRSVANTGRITPALTPSAAMVAGGMAAPAVQPDRQQGALPGPGWVIVPR
jgi:hypothetical protein